MITTVVQMSNKAIISELSNKPNIGYQGQATGKDGHQHKSSGINYAKYGANGMLS